ncbi:GNAT family N-acetyltransferase [Helicobacter rodentium]|uniref:GNAT family N-acetyltransferase n=1 Tax=Helicobacter rodentium TaxID=59617 RepID=UPI0023565422|nr:GNAT family N-acetyltransferase [Helicobacter rodentium]
MQFIVKKFEELTLDELYEILKIRVNVFVVEQKCAYQELDEKDRQSLHLYLRDSNGIQAYLRILPAGLSYKEVSIGRVLTLKRNNGFGREILKEGIKIAREKLQAREIRIGAQVYAKGFYEKFGFQQASKEYLEDGILHIQMLLQ